MKDVILPGNTPDMPAFRINGGDGVHWDWTATISIRGNVTVELGDGRSATVTFSEILDAAFAKIEGQPKQ